MPPDAQCIILATHERCILGTMADGSRNGLKHWTVLSHLFPHPRNSCAPGSPGNAWLSTWIYHAMQALEIESKIIKIGMFFLQSDITIE